MQIDLLLEVDCVLKKRIDFRIEDVGDSYLEPILQKHFRKIGSKSSRATSDYSTTFWLIYFADPSICLNSF